ncbi:MAG: hypothetical protein UU16_C0051G0005 [Candidatus Woesebacteria bacterium GW2011_GWA2_40_7]|uniref:Uncharacterized protein n=2 Tax=Candidatus Woeseibacteriota TaxID=1752722 RepID=A0A0G0P0E6_9BACT|nr:MAG: hypothetical protein UT17_C0005G0009 [Candidatus Woesebacteria bacterium GW2011_GWB1_39_10]KKR71872.1 MAG: hypothetical protein UU16_C0051G0005 [Candidatus Woesebacteria bacterium GW2011_GWA2_40_7]
MAKTVVLPAKKETEDRNLVEFLFVTIFGNTSWRVLKDSLKSSLRIPGVHCPFSLVVITTSEKLVAAIPEDDLYKIMLFDPRALPIFVRILEHFESDKTIVIETQ